MKRERLLKAAFEDAEWRVRAQAVSLAGDASGEGSGLFRLIGPREEQWIRNEDPRVLKFAVGPLLRRAAARAPSLAPDALLRQKVNWWLGHHDEILRAMAADFLMTFSAEFEAPAGSGEVSWAPQLTEPEREAWFSELYGIVESGLKDSSTDVRTIFVDGLAALAPGPRSLNLLSEALRDADHIVRGRAMTHLREKGIDPAVAPSRAAEMSVDEMEDLLLSARRIREARIVTSRGTLSLRLYPDDAPLTVHNFARLARQGYFDDKVWHRVVPDFVVQDGCPRGDGWGGPGYTIRCEINSLRYGAGALGMALSGKDTGGSQYFITHSPQPHLDGGYTVFGRLRDGWDVLQRLVPGDRIVSVRVIEGS
jgi:peptidyl-prolyl cis-trans isomerase B (cyclophilin B)